jgi:hypothetical protein
MVLVRKRCVTFCCLCGCCCLGPCMLLQLLANAYTSNWITLAQRWEYLAEFNYRYFGHSLSGAKDCLTGRCAMMKWSAICLVINAYTRRPVKGTVLSACHDLIRLLKYANCRLNDGSSNKRDGGRSLPYDSSARAGVQLYTPCRGHGAVLCTQ